MHRCSWSEVYEIILGEGSNQYPLHCKASPLTTGTPGKSPFFFFKVDDEDVYFSVKCVMHIMSQALSLGTEDSENMITS